MGTIIRAAIAYFFLLFTLRIIGRRSVDGMTTFELILIFLIGGLSIQSVVADDRSFVNALLGITTLGLCHVLVAWLKQISPSFGQVVDGTPILVRENGRWHSKRLGRLRIQVEDVMALARQSGVTHPEEIKYAVVERNGTISIIKSDGAA